MNNQSEQLKPAVAAASARFLISCEVEGFAVTVEVEGRADTLRATIDRLKTIGAQPLATKPAAEAAPAGPPVCPVHAKPMKPSRKPGQFFCPGRNADGSYCDHKA